MPTPLLRSISCDPCRWFLRRSLATKTLLLLPLLFQTASGSAAETLPRSMTLTDPLTGKSVALEAGAPLLHLVFFATWCPPCRNELPRLAELEARWRDGGYRLVLVAVPTRQSVERLRGFHETGQAPGELLFDSLGLLQAALGADQIPAHVLLDARGSVLLHGPALDSQIEAKIQEVLIQSARSAE